jgi:hypothetical protein
MRHWVHLNALVRRRAILSVGPQPLIWDTPLLRSLSIFQESTDSARVVHSLDSPATLPVKSGLQVLF